MTRHNSATFVLLFRRTGRHTDRWIDRLVDCQCCEFIQLQMHKNQPFRKKPKKQILFKRRVNLSTNEIRNR